MKLKRHEKIIELIEQYDIETQDELAELLRKEGFDVTQATVSRDIRKLALSKVPGKNGRQKYALLNHQDHQMAEKYVGILREAFVSMDAAQNILVIKTVSGMLGHFSAGFTLDTYAHVTTSAKREAAKTMGNILSGAV